MTDCQFCAIANDDAPATFAGDWADAFAIEPLNPVVPGHLLVIPRMHLRDAAENPRITGRVAGYAAELATPPFNLITSAGREATQTVFHLHWHIVPRTADDGLALPWTELRQDLASLQDDLEAVRLENAELRRRVFDS